MKKGLIVILFLFKACTIPYSEPVEYNLDIEVVLEAEKLAKAKVRRVYNLGENFDENKNSVSDLDILLFRNGDFFDSLQYRNDGLYESVRTLPIQGQYILKGVSKDKGTFESEPIEIPELIQVPSLEFKPDTFNFRNPSVLANYLELDFGKSLLGAYAFFEINFPENEENLHTSIWNNSEQVQKEINDCVAPFSTNFYKNGFIFDCSCLGLRQVSYLIEKEVFSNSNNPLPVRFNRMEVKVGLVSPAFFAWNKTKSIQPSGRERFNVDPVVTYSNIRGAYGVIYGLNSKTLVYP